MGFVGYIGGLALCVLAVFLAIFGVIVILGLFTIIPSSINLFFGIALLIIALVLFLYGRYLYLSSRPKGTINVHNV